VPLADPSLALVESWEAGHCKDPVYLYALSGTWPRYFLTNQAATATATSSYEAVLDEVASHDTPFVLYNDAPPSSYGGAAFTKEAFPVLGERSMHFEKAACATACTLFVGNAYLSGWSATVDGVPQKIYRANYAYMAIPLSAGTHDIVLTYR